MRILHVEDDDTFRKWVKQGLKESGFAVDGDCNAKEAMQMASENLYDVILLDIGMPDLSGSVGAPDTTTSWKYGRDFHYF
jgi:DNA-binding response OmpR family regulator